MRPGTTPELFFATLLITAVLAGRSAAAPLEVTIDDVRSTEGVLLVQITDDAEGFNDDRPPVASLMLAPAESSVTFSVDLEPSVYVCASCRTSTKTARWTRTSSAFRRSPGVLEQRTETWSADRDSIQFEMTTAAAVQNVSLVH